MNTNTKLNENGVVETVEGLSSELMQAMFGDAVIATHNALAEAYRQLADPMIVEAPGETDGWMQRVDMRLAARHAEQTNYRSFIKEAEELSRMWHSAAMAWKAAERVRWELGRLTEEEWTEADDLDYFNPTVVGY